MQQFPHRRTDNEHLAFARSREPQAKAFNDRVEAQSGDGREVQRLS